jgi:hypothetical protein
MCTMRIQVRLQESVSARATCERDRDELRSELEVERAARRCDVDGLEKKLNGVKSQSVAIVVAA